jgi:hypothetical protein
VDTTDYLIFMANQTVAPSIGSWEELVSVTFDAGVNSILLESEEGHKATIPCDDLAELHRLAQISYSLAEGYNGDMKWRIPVAAKGSGAKGSGAKGNSAEDAEVSK